MGVGAGCRSVATQGFRLGQRHITTACIRPPTQAMSCSIYGPGGRVMRGVMCLLFNERSATMRTAGIILALLFATPTPSAQATLELIGAPDAAIRTVVWTVPGGPPPPPERTVPPPEYRLPDRPNLPTQENQPGGHLPPGAK